MQLSEITESFCWVSDTKNKLGQIQTLSLSDTMSLLSIITANGRWTLQINFKTCLLCLTSRSITDISEISSQLLRMFNSCVFKVTDRPHIFNNSPRHLYFFLTTQRILPKNACSKRGKTRIPFTREGIFFKQGTCQSNNSKANFQVGEGRGKAGL